MPRGKTNGIMFLIEAGEESPITIRHLFYGLVNAKDARGNALMANTTANYKKVSRIMTCATIEMRRSNAKR
jgi:hypothetical protein